MEISRRCWPTGLVFIFILVIMCSEPCEQGAVMTENIVPPSWEISVKMPGVRPTKSDAYICMSQQLPDTESYIVRFEAIASQNTVHHMLIYSCEYPASTESYWDCGSMIGTCQDSSKGQIIYAWAKNAPPLKLPKDVGFKVSGSSGRKYIVMQLHYAHPFTEGVEDHSGVKLVLSRERQMFLAGIFLLGAWMAEIPPNSTGVHVDIACLYSNNVQMNAFAFRTHTHALGRVVSAYRIRNGEWTLLGKGNPQAPQAFYPMNNITSVRPGDYLVGRCTYDSEKTNSVTKMGATAADEMCNFYIMYFTQSSHTERGDHDCWDNENKELVKNFPPGSDTPVPLPPGMEELHHHHEEHGDSPLMQVHHHEGEEENPTEGMLSPGDVTSGEGSDVTNQETTSLESKDSQSSETNHESNDSQSSETNHESNDSQPSETSHESKDSQPSVANHETKDSQPSVANHETKDSQSTENENESSPIAATSHPHMHLAQNWPANGIEKGLGQVAGVSLNSKEHVLIFHRADRVWDGSTFDENNKLIDADKLGPIKEPTVWTIHPQTGQVISKWGKDLFYLPHGLTVDHKDNLWLTDVGLHQVFKFSAEDTKYEPELSLGEKFTPGTDNYHFCKPTSVAVDSITGEFFVADGYCNGRILKFKKDGTFLMKWGEPSQYHIGLQVAPPSTFIIPHKLSLDQMYGNLYVADRENNRIQCFDSITGNFIRQFELPQFGGRLFAVDFNQKGNVLYAVNGPSVHRDIHVVVQGFTLNTTSGELIETWSPSEQGFNQPHDVISTSDNTAVYVVEIGPNHVWRFTTDDSKHSPPVALKRSESPVDIKTKNISSTTVIDNLETVHSSEQDTNTTDPISPMPAIIITGVLLLPLIALLIAAIVRKVRSRRYVTVTNMDSLPALGQKRSICPLNCCRTSYYSFDKLQVDSDSDIDV